MPCTGGCARFFLVVDDMSKFTTAGDTILTSPSDLDHHPLIQQDTHPKEIRHSTYARAKGNRIPVPAT